MYFNCFLSLWPQWHPQREFNHRLKRCTGEPNDSSYQTADTKGEIRRGEVDIMDIKMQTLNDCETEMARITDNEIAIEDKESELLRAQSQTTGYTAQDLSPVQRYEIRSQQKVEK